MHVVKSVGVLSVAKILGLIYACMGLIFAPVLLLFGMLGSLLGQDKNPFAGMVGVTLALLIPVTDCLRRHNDNVFENLLGEVPVLGGCSTADIASPIECRHQHPGIVKHALRPEGVEGDGDVGPASNPVKPSLLGPTCEPLGGFASG